MTVLIDTHALVWWLLEPNRLSKAARDLISSYEIATYQEVLVSAVSVYEIDIKRDRDGALSRMPKSMPRSLPLLGFRILDVTGEDAWEAARLPLHHKDPWDRILIAQARRLDIALISKDEMLSAYDVPIIW